MAEESTTHNWTKSIAYNKHTYYDLSLKIPRFLMDVQSSIQSAIALVRQAQKQPKGPKSLTVMLLSIAGSTICKSSAKMHCTPEVHFVYPTGALAARVCVNRDGFNMSFVCIYTRTWSEREKMQTLRTQYLNRRRKQRISKDCCWYGH